MLNDRVSMSLCVVILEAAYFAAEGSMYLYGGNVKCIDPSLRSG